MPTLQELLQKADLYKEKLSCHEISGLHGSAYDFILELAKHPHMDITEDTIWRLHHLYYQGDNLRQTDQYRTTPVCPAGTEYAPPAPEDVPRLMGHLADQIRSSRSALHTIELVAMAHKRLVDIHPFLEGNTETACLLMNLILINAGYCPVSIPPARQDDYTNALSASRRLKDMEPFSKLIAEYVIEAEQDYCKQLGI